MNIETGFQINKPDIFVPWTISQRKLKKLLGRNGLRKITTGYFTISCVSFGEMGHELGFHFDPPTSNELRVFEFFRKGKESSTDQKKSYDTFQFYFEKEFGEPTVVTLGPEGFNTCIWRINSVEISHSVYDRFGPEEHMRIKRIPRKGFSVMKIFHSILSYLQYMITNSFRNPPYHRQ